MDFAAKHTGFVIAAYAAAFLLVGGLVMAEWLRARAVRRRLKELEKLGAPRRKRAANPGKQDNKEEQPA